MLSVYWPAATGLLGTQDEMNVIADNMANDDTTGFKSEESTFNDLIYQQTDPRGLSNTAQNAPTVNIGSGTSLGSITHVYTMGPISLTGNPLDIAVQGDGFIPVQTSTGQTAYTRDGHLQIDSAGNLTTLQGNKLQPPITIPANTTGVSIDQSGNVTGFLPGSTTPTTLGTIQLATFENPSGLLSSGQNLLLVSVDSGAAVLSQPGTGNTGKILSGAIENSNVDVGQQISNMVLTERTYAFSAKMMQTIDTMMEDVTNHS